MIRKILSTVFSVLLVAVGLIIVSPPALAQVKKGVAASVQFRSISISTEPQTSVWIDGVLFGKTDKDGNLTIKTISAGTHTIRFRADGYKEKLLTLTGLQKGEIKTVLSKTTDEADLAFQDAERLTTTDREKSAEAYRKAIKLRPNYPEAYLGLARVLSDAGDLENAMKAIVSARKLRPAYAEASAVQGRILKDSNEEDNAIAAFKRAIAEGKGFQPEALTGLGIIHKERAEGFGGGGDFEQENASYTEAGKYFRSAINQLSGAPDSLVVYQLLGLIFERQKKFDDAIALYEEFLRLYPESTEVTAFRSFIEQIKKQRSNEK